MLTPEYLNLIEFNDVVEIYNKLNIDITADIIKRVSQMQDITATTKKQLEILKQTNGEEIFKEALEKTANLTTETKKALKEIFEDMAKEDIKGYEELYQYRNKPFKLSDYQYDILNQGLNKTNRLLKNLTNTIAFQSKQAYVDTIDNAYMKTISGAFDYNTAIKQAVQELAEKGITLKDKLGRNLQLDVVVRRNVLNGIHETANNINRDIEDYLGCDGYEVTAHVGARPSHAEEQGKQFAINPRDAEKYKVGLWSDVVDLWSDYNCKHTYFGIILGVSEPFYTEGELKSFRNATVTLNGKKVPYYEAMQKQRQLENSIRKQKRVVQTLEKSNQSSILQKSKLIQLQKNYKAFGNYFDSDFDIKYNKAKVYTTKESDNLTKLYKKELDSLTPEQRHSISKYTTVEYSPINTRLRTDTGATEKVGKEIDNITESLNKCKTIEDMILHRHVEFEGLSKFTGIKEYQLKESSIEELNKMLKEKEYIDKAFVSTSIKDFRNESREVVYDIYVPKGTKGLYINELSTYFKDIEYEFLLQRETRFKIRKVFKDTDNTLRIVMEVIGNEI